MYTSFGIYFLVLSVLTAVQGNKTMISEKSVNPKTTGGIISIYNGKNISVQKHPYMVTIQVDESKYCTGAIVSESWILTTADCAQENHKSMNVIMHRRYNKVRKVKNVTLHPSYPSDVYDYDFACIQIRGKFHFSKGVKPVRIPMIQPHPGSVMVVAGWIFKPLRSTDSESKDHAELEEGMMNWLSNSDCNSTLTQMGITWTNRKACVYNRNRTTLCTGAWGAPVVQDGVLYGQFVGGEAEGFCSSSAAPVIISDISSVADWVHDVTGAVVDERVY